MKILSEKIMSSEELEDFSVMTIDYCGNKYWKDKEGRFHREDGPAIDGTDGYKAWFLNGKPA